MTRPQPRLPKPGEPVGANSLETRLCEYWRKGYPEITGEGSVVGAGGMVGQRAA